MSTMYETIMELPLFKGVSHSMVSSFLEKTHVDFINLKAGEEIIKEGDRCDRLRFIISGTVVMKISTSSPDIEITQSFGPKSVIGAEYLFGLTTSFPFSLSVKTDASILQFNKEQYTRLLQTDPIYRINYYNYLSARAQRNPDWIRIMAEKGIIPFIRNIIDIFTNQYSEGIMIRISPADLCSATGLTAKELDNEINILTKENLGTYSDGVIRIESRSRIIDYIYR